MLTDR
jgi:hypothetical protein